MSKTYAFSDLHGNYNLWKEIQNYLKENDKAYCLGDCCDRGPNGVKIMQEVLKDERITYLLGNHEIMFLDTKDTKLKSLTKQEKEDLKYNGTIETIRQYFELTEEEQIGLTNQLKNLPCCTEYINKNNQKVFLSHAGGNPDYLEFADMTYLTWNRTHMGVSSWKYYQKRFPKEMKFELQEIPPCKRFSKGSEEKAKEAEAKLILEAIPKKAYIIALDERGKQYTSIELSKKVGQWQQLGCDVVLLVGGPNGLTDEIREKANELWSLSKLTLPHPLVRVFLIETVYRGYSIFANLPYHRE